MGKYLGERDWCGCWSCCCWVPLDCWSTFLFTGDASDRILIFRSDLFTLPPGCLNLGEGKNIFQRSCVMTNKGEISWGCCVCSGAEVFKQAYCLICKWGLTKFIFWNNMGGQSPILIKDNSYATLQSERTAASAE